jgi:hypothetical protein
VTAVLVTGTGAMPPKDRNPRFGSKGSFSCWSKVPRSSATEKTAAHVSGVEMHEEKVQTWILHFLLADSGEEKGIIRQLVCA